MSEVPLYAPQVRQCLRSHPILPVRTAREGVCRGGRIHEEMTIKLNNTFFSSTAVTVGSSRAASRRYPVSAPQQRALTSLGAKSRKEPLYRSVQWFRGGLVFKARPAPPNERKHGLSTEQFPVSAYVGSSKNLKDLKNRLPQIHAARANSLPTPTTATCIQQQLRA